MRFLAVFLFLTSAALADDILVFTRSGCGPCKRFKEDLSKNDSMASPHKIVFSKDEKLAKSYGVNATPTFIRLRGGKEVDRKVGYSNAANWKAWAK